MGKEEFQGECVQDNGEEEPEWWALMRATLIDHGLSLRGRFKDATLKSLQCSTVTTLYVVSVMYYTYLSHHGPKIVSILLFYFHIVEQNVPRPRQPQRVQVFQSSGVATGEHSLYR